MAHLMRYTLSGNPNIPAAPPLSWHTPHRSNRDSPYGGVSHTVASRENVLHRFPGRRGFSALKGTPPDPRAEYLMKRGNRY